MIKWPATLGDGSRFVARRGLRGKSPVPFVMGDGRGWCVESSGFLFGFYVFDFLLDDAELFAGKIRFEAFGVVDEDGFVGFFGVEELAEFGVVDAGNGHLGIGAKRTPGHGGDDCAIRLQGLGILCEGFMEFGLQK